MGPGVELSLRAPFPGLYNVYNMAAAAATALALDLPTAAVKTGIENLKAAFGRQERILVGQGHLTLVLVKNPVGCNQALTTLPKETSLVLFALNDHFADGTDVSWIWDVDAEVLTQNGRSLLATGTRANDMAVRLKYAGADDLQVESDLAQALDRALAAASEGGEVFLLATYTATLEARRGLERRGHIAPFWED
jgi:UDP-N-acetylmuramyl tripeptide synthase